MLIPPTDAAARAPFAPSKFSTDWPMGDGVEVDTPAGPMDGAFGPPNAYGAVTGPVAALLAPENVLVVVPPILVDPG